MSAFFATQAEQSIGVVLSQRASNNVPLYPYRGTVITRWQAFAAGKQTFGADAYVTQATEITTQFFYGVTDGSVKSFGSTVSADVNEIIPFQTGSFVQLQVDEDVFTGDWLFLKEGAEGKFAASFTQSVMPPPPFYLNDARTFVALEDGATDEIIWAYRISSFQVSQYVLNPYPV